MHDYMHKLCTNKIHFIFWIEIIDDGFNVVSVSCTTYLVICTLLSKIVSAYLVTTFLEIKFNLFTLTLMRFEIKFCLQHPRILFSLPHRDTTASTRTSPSSTGCEGESFYPREKWRKRYIYSRP